MDDEFLPPIQSSVSAKDLADALRRFQFSGTANQVGNNSALLQGRLGYEFPLDQSSNIVAGVSGQKALNNQYIPTRPTGVDIGYNDPRQSFTVGYNANPTMIDGAPIGPKNWSVKYQRSF